MAQQQRQRFERQLRAGVQAAQQGNKERARELLEGVLRQDRNNQLGYNELAWIWMASIVDSQKERRVCLQKVLEINPGNRPAREAINNLVGVIGSTDNIDYNQMAAAARAKMPTGGGEATPRGGRRGGGGGQAGGNSRMLLLGGAAVVIGLLLAASFVLPGILAPDPTATPVPTDTATVETIDGTPVGTATPLPATNTPERPQLEGAVTVTPLAESETPLPTDTPTITPTPTETPLPTATLPPVADQTVYIVSDGSGDFGTLYRVLGDGTGVQRVADNVNVVDINVDADRIAFTRPVSQGEGASGEILQAFVGALSNPDDALQATRLTRGAVEAVSISPDGSQMVYASTEDGDSELYLLNLQTGVVRKLTDNSFNDTDPSWSADGSRIVFTSDRNSLGFNDVFVYTVAGGAETEVVDTSNNATSPQFSPDGSQITYADARADTSRVYVGSADGVRVRQIQFNPSNNVVSPIWTSDGIYVVFIAKYDGRGDELVFQTPDNTVSQPLFIAEVQQIRAVIAP